MTVTVLDDALAPAQLDHYRDFGWAVAPGFFSATEVAAIAGWTDALLAGPERSGGPMLYREASLLDPAARVVQRIEDFCPHHEEFDALVRHGRLARAAERLLGGPALLFKEKINFKMPGGAGFEPHQDQQAGWSAYAPLFVTALVAIDAATCANGCLEMTTARRQHGLIGREWAPLSEAELVGTETIPVETAPGDVVFFDSFAPHGSKPNLTDRARRILYITWNRAADGDHRARYYADKRAAFPPDIDRRPGVEYRFRV